MSKCNFSFNAVSGTDQLLEKARTAIVNTGGQLSGDGSSGSFTLPTPLGTVKGNYSMSADSINLTITDKPMFVSCNKIEEKLKEYLAG